MTIWAASWWCLTPPAFPEERGEARFFADCPRRGYVRLHDERSPWDPHALLYTAMGLSEVEIFRAADWLIDLPLPAQLRLFQRTMRAVRAGYHRLPPWRLTQRVGEFVEALQVPELSFGDASSTYSVATGGTTGPGSGMVIRLYKLVDWTQHVTGDVNRSAGSLVGRPRGLVTWSLPERAIDGVQWMLLKTFNSVSVLMARGIDAGLTGMELAAEGVRNIGYRPPHQQQTVFLRMPMEVYRVHELWMLEHRSRIVLDSAKEFARLTHAALAHHRRPVPLEEWSRVDQWGAASEVVVMTTVQGMSRAPAALQSYVVPAAWILNDTTETQNVHRSPEETQKYRSGS